MTRGTFIFLIFLVLFAGLAAWGLPAIKRQILGESLQVRYTILLAEDDYEVQYQDQTVSRTVIGLEILFPMGGAPLSTNDLVVLDDDGTQLPVVWTNPERTDMEDQRITRWVIREAFFPIGFRQGMLRTQHRDLCYIRLTQVPYRK